VIKYAQNYQTEKWQKVIFVTEEISGKFCFRDVGII
jgi:hypothetical protein